MVAAVVVIVLTAAIFSDTAFGRGLRRSMARLRLPSTAGGRLMLLAMLIGLAGALWLLGRIGALGLGAQAVPELAAGFVGFDLATVLDAAAVLMIGAVVAYARPVVAWVLARVRNLTRVLRHRRARRWRRPRKGPALPGDDDGPRGLAIAWTS